MTGRTVQVELTADVSEFVDALRRASEALRRAFGPPRALRELRLRRDLDEMRQLGRSHMIGAKVHLRSEFLKVYLDLGLTPPEGSIVRMPR